MSGFNSEAGSIYAGTDRAMFQYDIVGGAVPWGVVSGTETRDVSDVLDLLALADTPFINRVGWGGSSDGTCIEWLSEDLGPGWFRTISGVVSGVGASILVGSVDGVTGSDLSRMIHDGTVIYVFSSANFDGTNNQHSIGVVTSEPATAASWVTCVVASWLLLDTYVSAIGSMADSGTDEYYILGNVAQEGSIPKTAKPRDRVICTNGFTILRQDVAITGTMKNTGMYAIGREDKHQILMRMKEMQRERERMALYSVYSAKTTTLAGLMNGVFGYLTTQTGGHIDRSTTAFTNTALNTVLTKIWENGGRNLALFGPIAQTAKITRWDVNRIATRINDRKGGGYISSYLSESGIEVDIIPMANCPHNLLFIVDPSRIQLRAKKNRKAILEKLGRAGDSDAYQLISEFSMEMKGYNLIQHGMFTVLA